MEIPKTGDNSAQYKKEIQEGVQIFEKSFKGVEQTKSFPQKKLEFEKSTKEALQAIQDAAKGLMNKEILAQKEKLEKDYQQYLDKPTAQNQEKVQDDIENLKDSAQ